MRTFLFAAAIFIVYQSIIWTGLIPPGVGRDNYETNLITAESWRYKNAMPAALLVGSSKTNFLNYDVLGKDVAHFGFGGQGCLTGLEILQNSSAVPKLILVEIGDTLQWSEDDDCVRIGSTKSSAEVFSALQHRYQPCALVLYIFNKLYPRQTMGPAVRAQLIQLQLRQLDVPLREARKQQTLDKSRKAQQLIANLEQRGAQVVLFDAPVEDEIMQSRYVSEIRTLVNSVFDRKHYHWLINPAGPWHTRDGTHFDAESGNLYSLWLREQIDILQGEHHTQVHR